MHCNSWWCTSELAHQLFPSVFPIGLKVKSVLTGIYLLIANSR
ncbi:147_t:CDS:2 [Entrophospora sp. SA101]|nr:147_t:CDS:2 [Entrophospora sp. SA101]